MGFIADQGIEFDAAKVASAGPRLLPRPPGEHGPRRRISADTVAAVSAGYIIAPSVFFARCAALDEARKNDAETFDNLATAYARAATSLSPSWVRSTTAA